MVILLTYYFIFNSLISRISLSIILQMFKKNRTRPAIVINLKKTQGKYRVLNNDQLMPFSIQKVIRNLGRNDFNKESKIEGDLRAMTHLNSSNGVQCPNYSTMPSSAKWFNIDEIHDIEKEMFSDFFVPQKQGNYLSFSCKDMHLYRYYRDQIVGMWRQNSKKHLSAGVCRRNLPGDVANIVRIHAFLQNWGIINFPSKEHKGILTSKPNNLQCYICQTSYGPFFAAPVEDIYFQICTNCLEAQKYPNFIPKQSFQKLNEQLEKPTMKNEEIIKFLGILGNLPKDKQKDSWSNISKQMPQYSKEELLKNLLLLPLTHPMNSSIFEQGEDIIIGKQIDHKPTIFEDFQNPIQSSIAICYYIWKNQHTHSQWQQINRIMKMSELHSNYLADKQKIKIQDLTKMLVQLQFSKIQLKILFLHQYEKLIEHQHCEYRKITSNSLAESLKINYQQKEQENEKSDIQNI